MEEIKVNDYIRTVDGIKKVIAINTGTRVTIYGKYVLDKDYKGIRPAIAEKNILKHSSNIIDLIEVGDYVNGKYVFDVFEKDGKKYLKVDCMYGYYSEDEIGEVVTHEQFKNMVYRLED